VSYRTNLGTYGQSTDPNNTFESRVSDDPVGVYSKDPAEAEKVLRRLLAQMSTEVEGAYQAVLRAKRPVSVTLSQTAAHLRRRVDDLRARMASEPAVNLLTEYQQTYHEISESAGSLRALAERINHGPSV